MSSLLFRNIENGKEQEKKYKKYFIPLLYSSCNTENTKSTLYYYYIHPEILKNQQETHTDMKIAVFVKPDWCTPVLWSMWIKFWQWKLIQWLYLQLDISCILNGLWVEV